MTEFWLFIIVGGIAIAFAAMMLLSQNAVYSAMSLIVTMGCIAFLFLLLDAPFLAMIQITVYAGAIMVLFIFVIMLLGAERLGTVPSRFRWLSGGAFGLATIFLIVMGMGIINSGVDSQYVYPKAPMVRIINATTDAGTVEVLAGDDVIASDVGFRDPSAYVSVAAGEQAITIASANGGSITETLTLESDTVQTLVAYGQGDDLALVVVPSDLSTPSERRGRLTVVNAYAGAGAGVSLVDLGFDGKLDDPTDITRSGNDFVLVEDFVLGEVSEPILLPEGTINLGFVRGDNLLYTLRDLQIERETVSLVVLSGESLTLADGERVVAEPVFVQESDLSFGGPEQIGRVLFTKYLLPFELVSLLLLATMVGAIILTHKQGARVRDRSARRRRVSRPLASVISQQVGQDVAEADEESPKLPGVSAGD